MEIKRGKVYWVNLDPTKGAEIKKKRPCVVMSENPINRARRTVVVIPLSSSPNEYAPITFKVKCKDKLVVAVLDQIRAIDKSRIIAEFYELSSKDMKKITKNLKIILGL